MESLFTEFEQVNLSAEVAYNATLALMEETSALGVSSRAEANQLLIDATGQALEALGYIDVRKHLLCTSLPQHNYYIVQVFIYGSRIAIFHEHFCTTPSRCNYL